MRRTLPPFLALFGLLGTLGFTHADEAEVDYVKHVQPLLKKHCVACHSAKKQQSGLRLDVIGYAVEGGDRGAAFIPGKPKESLLVQTLRGEGDSERMPLEQPALADRDIELIARWIKQGAKFPEAEAVLSAQRRTSAHWSFQPLRHPIPPTSDSPWVRNPIDAFVLKRLKAEKLSPSADAERGLLIRRLSLDLRGITPSTEEVDAFLDDQTPDAYERLVDSMLAAPQYGERWGRHWLDLARYADSNGFTIDGPRKIWKYREWVIDALNRDLPFDRFTIEQLAGDLLKAPRRDQLVATGFHRNTLINQEGGTDDEQFRVEAVVDRTNTTGAVFLGLTIGCAQCHEHKYDPFTQREFYQLYAFFNNTQDVNSPAPTLSLPTPTQEVEQASIKQALASAQQALKEYDVELASGRSDWEQAVVKTTMPDWKTITPDKFASEQRATINKKDDQSLIVGGNGNIPAHDTYTIEAESPLRKFSAIRLEAMTDKGLPQNGPGLNDEGSFVLNEFIVTASPLDADGKAGKPQPVKFVETASDWSQTGFPSDQTIDGNNATGWAIGVEAKGDSLNEPREVVFLAEQPLENEHGWRLNFKLVQKDKKAKSQIGRLRLSLCEDLAAGQPVAATAIRELLKLPDSKRNEIQRARVVAAHARSDRRRKPLERDLAKAKKRESDLRAAVATSMVLRERKEARETRIQLRGDFLRVGAVVQPNVPDVLPPMPDPDAPNRLDLAEWLVGAENPLTARVTVNRFWQRLFGLGLVETENDFGLQGALPSHPDLLDWLATEFIRLGWSTKQLHRLIVTSSTYRQASAFRTELLDRDPRNRLLARQSRVRMEAEAIRDCCLSASGLLANKLGGPSVYPPQPKGIHVLTQVTKQWPEAENEDRFRRGLYIYFWRSNPYPFLPTFDAPDATMACTRRGRSNTPLQALTLANDRAFFEFARGLSGRVLREAKASDRERIRFAVRACLSRNPTDYERKRLTEFLDQQRSFYDQNSEAAKLAEPMNAPKTITVAEGAAWTALARVLLNLDEFVTRD